MVAARILAGLVIVLTMFGCKPLPTPPERAAAMGCKTISKIVYIKAEKYDPGSTIWHETVCILQIVPLVKVVSDDNGTRYESVIDTEHLIRSLQ